MCSSDTIEEHFSINQNPYFIFTLDPLFCNIQTPIKIKNHLFSFSFFFFQLIRWGLGSIGTPTAQVHDFPKRLLRSLCPRSAPNHRRRRRRELVIGLREWLDEVVLGVVVNRPHGVVPPAEALVLQRLHRSDARRNDPSFACRTHDDVNFLKNLWVIVCCDADDMEVFVCRHRCVYIGNWVVKMGIELKPEAAEGGSSFGLIAFPPP